MPTVTSMLKTLSERGLVDYEKYEYIELTDRGSSLGKEVRRKHEAVQKFLIEILKVDAVTANAEACKMEHALSLSTLESLIDFMEFIQQGTFVQDDGDWLTLFGNYRSQKHKAPARGKETS